ncbi:flagellar basal body rod protein FlgB [Limnochorda pilosa]|uniref:Flagellar basal body rod protein FlgB n=1 Tax=Limnochorda pilosa TaxID=1555112 RepID=A0A0K2SKW3_LIMPI|nr:flagellar basal body rod protein FlgB [Limnochorda pilosa]BAS27494.1 flagellar basal body rod protein FlgB [Limnochorda pilosa]
MEGWPVTERFLGARLDQLLLKQRVVAENIANANTPGYKRKDVTFPAELERAGARLPVWRTHPEHLPVSAPEGGPRVVVDSTTVMRNDINNVDVEKETASLAQAQILYNALVEQLNRGYKRISLAVREGRA